MEAFEADRNHMHHVLLDKGMSHKQASISLGLLNVLVILIYLIFSPYLNSWGMSVVMLGIFVLTGFGFEVLKKYPHVKWHKQVFNDK